MVERFLPSNDPIKEEVLDWTVKRDAQDIKILLEWLHEARSFREKKAMISLIEGSESATKTLAPDSTSLAVIAWPIPLSPPVTIPRFPDKSIKLAIVWKSPMYMILQEINLCH